MNQQSAVGLYERSPSASTNSGFLPTMLFTVIFVLEVHPQSPTAAKLKSADKDAVLFVLLIVVLVEPFKLLLLLLLLLLAPYVDIFHL